MSLERTRTLLGDGAMERLKDARVAVVGLGGVGGYIAESLARSGVGRLHLVDADIVEASNLNRQIFAAKSVIGLDKVEAARRRIEEVSDCAVTVKKCFVTSETVEQALDCELDFVVDAIDSLSGKVALIDYCKANGIAILSCMGAGNKLDPTAFRVADIYKTEQCPLARRLRQELRRKGITDVPVVFSTEKNRSNSEGVIGSFAPVVGACGLVAAAEVTRMICKEDWK